MKTDEMAHISNSVTVGYGKAGRGLFANKTIRGNELVVSIPLDQMITEDYIRKSLALSYPKWTLMQLDCHGMFALFIALELRKGETSKFATYLKTMPTSYDLVLVNWPEDYDHLLMEHVLESKKRLKELYAARYEKINDFYNADHKMTWIREEEFRYGFSAVITRGMNWPYGAPRKYLPLTNQI